LFRATLINGRAKLPPLRLPWPFARSAKSGMIRRRAGCRRQFEFGARFPRRVVDPASRTHYVGVDGAGAMRLDV